MSPTGYASSQIKDTLARAVCRKNIGASTSEFPLGGVRCQGVTAPPSPPGTLRWMEYPYSSSRARQILQIHRETRKQPHNFPERGNVALCLGLYKIDILGPQGSLFILGLKMKRSAILQPRQDSNIRPQSFDLGCSPLRQAPFKMTASCARGHAAGPGDVLVPFRRALEYKVWSNQRPLGLTTFGCTLHFRGSPLGEDYSANAPNGTDSRGLTGSSSWLAVLSKQLLLWISHTTPLQLTFK